MERKLYMIPGVATDHRVFQSLDLPGHELKYLNWLRVHPRESMEAYARRMTAGIEPGSRPVLVGYSFGGMVAIEMAKQIEAEAVILISSIKHYHERPFSMMFTSTLGLNSFVPSWIGKEFRFAYSWLNEPQDDTEHAFIDAMKAQLDHDHTDWAVHQALAWRHSEPLDRVFHIHGDRDRIFPMRYIKNAIPIKGGTHLMLLNKGVEISHHIDRIVQGL